MRFFVLVAGLASACCTLAAQEPAETSAQQRATDPGLRIINAEEHDPLVPIAEREWKQKTEGPTHRGPILVVPSNSGPRQETQLVPRGTVSARTLRNPLSDKARKLIEKAQKQIRKQDYEAARKTLESVLAMEDGRPYALAISGSMELTQYIRKNDPNKLSAALAQLIEAVPQIPDDVSARSNLGLAHYFAGNQDEALSESSKALQMDPARAKTRYVIGLILANQHRYSEAVYHLKIAAPEMAAANDLLQRVQQLAAQSPPAAPQ